MQMYIQMSIATCFFQNGAVFFEWDGSKLNQVPAPPNGPSDTSYFGHMLVLPTGQILFTDFSGDVEPFHDLVDSCTRHQSQGTDRDARRGATFFLPEHSNCKRRRAGSRERASGGWRVEALKACRFAGVRCN